MNGNHVREMQDRVALPPENIYGHTKKLRFILDHVRSCMREHDRPITLLDFGCGNGRAVSQFLMGEGIEYYGVDIHDECLAYARRHFGRENACFLKEIPSDVTFDIVVYADVLEHVDDPVALLREHYRVLRHGGMVLGSVPNGYGPFELEKKIENLIRFEMLLRKASQVKRKLFGRNRSDAQPLPPYNVDSGHVQFFTRRELRSTLARGGFELASFRHGSFVGAPMSAMLVLRGEKIARINARVADFLPYWLVSTWYFAARKPARSRRDAIPS